MSQRASILATFSHFQLYFVCYIYTQVSSDVQTVDVGTMFTGNLRIDSSVTKETTFKFTWSPTTIHADDIDIAMTMPNGTNMTKENVVYQQSQYQILYKLNMADVSMFPPKPTLLQNIEVAI